MVYWALYRFSALGIRLPYAFPIPRCFYVYALFMTMASKLNFAKQDDILKRNATYSKFEAELLQARTSCGI